MPPDSALQELLCRSSELELLAWLVIREAHVPLQDIEDVQFMLQSQWPDILCGVLDNPNMFISGVLDPDAVCWFCLEDRAST